MINDTLILDIPAQAAASLGDLTYEKEVIYVDTFEKNDPQTGELLQRFTVSEADIDNWIKQDVAQREAGLDIHMPVGHVDDPEKTAGTVLSLSKRLDHKGRMGLFAKFKFKTADLAASLKDTKVSIFSPVAYHHNGRMFSRPIRHIAFTNDPAIPDLGPTVIAASAASSIPKGKPKMKISELALQLGIKHGEDLTDDGIGKAIVSHVNGLTEQITKLSKPAEEKKEEVAASVDSALKDQIASLTKTNRKMRIDSLLLSTKIDAAQAKELVDKFCGDNLSLSTESNAAFEAVIALCEKNRPLQLSGERSGSQGGTKSEESPIVRQARERAQANKK